MCFVFGAKAQLQDAKRRWEELQNYLHNVNAEREKLQAAKQGTEIKRCAVHLTVIAQNINEWVQFYIHRVPCVRAPGPAVGGGD